jgi:uncharacterized protein with HEPN domain
LPPKDETLYIEELLGAIQRIFQYTKEGREGFFSQPMVQDAVALNLIVIGEAAKNLSEATRSRAPEIEWKQIAGMRDRLTHAYPTTDPRIVWQVVEEELEPLRAAVEKLRS